MLAAMAAEDIKHLQGLGVALTPGQIVRINDLALRATRGAEGANFAHAPRVAWAGPVPLFEPTIQAEMWLRDLAAVWWCGASLQIATAWASAHAPETGFFAQWTDERKTRRAIEAWQRTLACTADQLWAALEYALTGIPRETADASPADAWLDGCPYSEILADAIACGIGATVAELRTLPPRTATDIIARWTRNQVALAGGAPSNLKCPRDIDAYEDYVKSLEPKGDAADGQG